MHASWSLVAVFTRRQKLPCATANGASKLSNLLPCARASTPRAQVNASSCFLLPGCGWWRLQISVSGRHGVRKPKTFYLALSAALLLDHFSLLMHATWTHDVVHRRSIISESIKQPNLYWTDLWSFNWALWYTWRREIYRTDLWSWVFSFVL